MKHTLLSSAVALTVSALALPASAIDGTITIKGKLTQATCTVKVNNGSPDATITLPSLSTSTLKSKEAAGKTAFTLNLTGCTDTIKGVRAYFEHGTTVDASTGRLNNTDTTGAKNVQVEIRDNDDKPVYVGNTSQRAVKAMELTSGGADLLYSANYYAEDASTVVAGNLETLVTYSIDYE